ncbi:MULTISPECIES: DUF2939 domain-containing protein [Marichromatium]|uniref:DUF2939 family protein n=1 Tax=Marichromatium gracile TaxID=1048 RepID=A0A4R4A528_MARGR|nr:MULTISPECIES: DUF2939 domain-containing protein [Marichromatium]MBK1709485.1 hypothetical protein [Marichromatium gracile]MBO8085314.1 DUF2939 domain-containing protein [Marichromatium sp.]RNE93146.1 DUF2939 domain-containing protein [Marichromatium sp. AB32]TCW33192.1 DUF2939 family protein [Marichromatium gracile]
MRFLGYLILLALLGYGLWPYYAVYQLDDAINQEDTTELAALVDLPAIRANYKARIAAGVEGMLPAGEAGGVMHWLRQNVGELGDAALEQAITLPWARQTLREAVGRATSQTPPYLLAGIDYAFFESYDRFLVRIGQLGKAPTHVRLELEGREWRITDIIR